MKVLTDEEQAKVTEALRLAAVYIQDHSSPDSPVREVGEALELMTRTEPADYDHLDARISEWACK